MEKKIFLKGHYTPEQLQGKIMDAAVGYNIQDAEQITNDTKARKLVQAAIAGSDREKFLVIFMNNKNRIIKTQIMFEGTYNSATIHTREVVKRSLELNAATIIIAHNHPSGDASPSNSDDIITRRIVAACELVEIKLLDHIIVGGSDEVYSYRREGKL